MKKALSRLNIKDHRRNNNVCFETLINSKITDSLLNRTAVSFLITHQSYLLPPPKKGLKRPPPTPFGNCLLLDPPPPPPGSEFLLPSVGGGGGKGMDICCNARKMSM